MSLRCCNYHTSAGARDDFKPLLNLFVFHNEFWAVEDNLVAKNEEEHFCEAVASEAFGSLKDAHSKVLVSIW